MEVLSDIVTWGELYLNHYESGSYQCARCGHSLYSSEDKWKGPCRWPSFRNPSSDDSLNAITIENYNNYTCTVREVHCGKCDLFLGHQFEDGVLKGDTHQNARWRH